MSGLPVVVAGRTHYRGRGFTLDPTSWETYFAALDSLTAHPADFRLSEAQTRLAWKYAYHFFFDYPRPFPWHIVHLKEDLQKWPLRAALGRDDFRTTLAAMARTDAPAGE